MVLANGHSCDRGNRTLRWSQFCDGIFDCLDRSDEEGHFCKLCINNLYSCPPNDDIRCDLACQMLHYVPCQTIQDRRACYNIQTDFDEHFLFKELKFYIIAGILIIILIGIFILIKYFQQRFINSAAKTSKMSDDSHHHPIETDTISSHIYEQCDETSLDKFVLKYSYYEHAV